MHTYPKCFFFKQDTHIEEEIPARSEVPANIHAVLIYLIMSQEMPLLKRLFYFVCKAGLITLQLIVIAGMAGMAQYAFTQIDDTS